MTALSLSNTKLKSRSPGDILLRKICELIIEIIRARAQLGYSIDLYSDTSTWMNRLIKRKNNRPALITECHKKIMAIISQSVQLRQIQDSRRMAKQDSIDSQICMMRSKLKISSHYTLVRHRKSIR